MEKRILTTRVLTITVTDFDDLSQDIQYEGDLRAAEKIGICEHLRVEALQSMGRRVYNIINDTP